MFHRNRNILLDILILINKLEQSFAIFELVLDSCFISVKHRTDHVIIMELVIYINRDETEIKWRIVKGILDSRSYTSIQIDNSNCAGAFKCIIVGHDKKIRQSH